MKITDYFERVSLNKKNIDENKDEKVELYFDGGSRGNPGPGGCGVSIKKNNREILSAKKYLGICTNNYAEYKALELGLEEAINNNIDTLIVYGDSLLVINHVKKIWKCKNTTLKNILENILILTEKFKLISFMHIRREKNTRADELANIAMDEA